MQDIIKEAFQSYDAIVFMGVKGSGKSTTARAFAQRREMTFLDAEELRSDDSEDEWLASLNRTLLSHAEKGRKVALAFSALKEAQRQALAANGLRLCFALLEGDIASLEKRTDSGTAESELAELEVPSDAIRIDIRQHIESIMTYVDFQLIQMSALSG